MPCCPSPLTLLRDSLRGQRQHDKDLWTLISNLPYQALPKTTNHYFPGNSIKTTKYSFWFFIPMNLWERFHRFANVYFVGLALLNFVPAVEAFQPEVALIPICVILTLTALKDGWEDYRRYRSDRRINHTPCLIYSRKEGDFVERRWKDVRVGDFVKVVSNEILPADLLLLHTSDHNGVCHIETATLDGETNLKQRQVVPGLYTQDFPFKPQHFNSTVVVEKPNDNLNHFKGYIETADNRKLGFGIDSLLLRGCTVRNTDHAAGFVVYAGRETKSMLNNNRPRYKCSKLERKMNMDVLFCVIVLFCMCLVGALGHYIWLESFPSMPLFLIPDSHGHLDQPPLSSFYMFFTMIILLQILIPISLYVSIEIVKVGQVFFITNDIDLYDEETDSRVQCRTLNITEDLGQILYVFSDKTGTLTENKMVFRRCTIMGTEYAHNENDVRLAVLGEADDTEEEVLFHQRPLPLRTGWTLEDNHDHDPEVIQCCHGAQRQEKERSAQGEVAFSSPLETEVVPDRKLLQRVLRGGGDGPGGCQETDLYLDFFLALAVCNTVVVSTATRAQAQRRRASGCPSPSLSQSSVDLLQSLVRKMSSLLHTIRSWQPMTEKEDLDNTNSSLSGPVNSHVANHHHTIAEGQASQTNTKANIPRPGLVVDTADQLCYEAESPDEAALVYAAKAYGFTLLARTPDSVTVRLPHGQELTYQVLDTLTFDPIRKRMSVVLCHPITREIVMYTKGADYTMMELLETPYAENRMEGSHKNIPASTQKHLDWYAKEGLRTLCLAKKVLSKKANEDWSLVRQDAVATINNREELLMETATHLETHLTLLGATGIEDRLQDSVPDTITALREAGIQVWVLTGDKPETAVNIAYTCRLLDQGDLVINMRTNNKAVCASTLDCTLEEVRQYVGPGAPGDPSPSIGLVIDGHTLGMALESDLVERFVELARSCRSVLCCRVTPLQKSTVVKVVRERLKVMTLAIGDGASDVNMIQAADVGIGISGQEGMQAVMASDFSISCFKHMKKLLLAHGHWCYRRLANMAIYFFYKNVTYVNLLFWYQFYCGFSGTSMIDIWLIIFFNLFFTSAPPIMFGVMDRNFATETLLGLPELYRSGQGSEGYNHFTFWIAMLDAFYQSLVCFFIPFWTYHGSDIDIYTFGTPINTVSLFTILLHLAIEIKTWTVVHWVIMLGSVSLYFMVTLVYSAVCISCNPPSDPYWILQQQMTDPMFYLVCVITTVVALLPRYTYRVLINTVAPSPIVRARHLERLDPTTKEQWIREWRGLRGESTWEVAQEQTQKQEPSLGNQRHHCPHHHPPWNPFPQSTIRFELQQQQIGTSQKVTS
ncbi:LOW QUALITY PROTEIN: phospholipid-transporting ATPase VB [Salmo salar]|uniref:Phospholipid-transporting ATPase n=1 Tax=Salmo salar TaxID=8030 RepID=A0ABM3FA33_SALSA|nr:LOW QUALITY PROTEIN: phospholipid-transporting ATPase VB [Salmo salar]